MPHLEVLSLYQAGPDEGQCGAPAQKSLRNIAHHAGRHVEARVPA